MRKIEYLLLAVPLLFLAIFYIRAPVELLDFHIHDTMYVVAVSHFFWLLFFLMCLYLVIHLILRKKKWRNRIIGNSHVIISVIAILVIGVQMFVRPTPLKSIDADVYRKIPFGDKILAICALGFILAQILFLFYFLFTFIIKSLIRQSK